MFTKYKYLTLTMPLFVFASDKDRQNTGSYKILFVEPEHPYIFTMYVVNF